MLRCTQCEPWAARVSEKRGASRFVWSFKYEVYHLRVCSPNARRASPRAPQVHLPKNWPYPMLMCWQKSQPKMGWWQAAWLILVITTDGKLDKTFHRMSLPQNCLMQQKDAKNCPLLNAIKLLDFYSPLLIFFTDSSSVVHIFNSDPSITCKTHCILLECVTIPGAWVGRLLLKHMLLLSPWQMTSPGYCSAAIFQWVHILGLALPRKHVLHPPPECFLIISIVLFHLCFLFNFVYSANSLSRSRPLILGNRASISF